MHLTLHATPQTPHGASRLVQAMSAWLVKTRHAPSRHCRDARVYGHTTTAMHEIEYISPIEYTPPSLTKKHYVASLASKGVAAEAKAYASERGGDVRQLVVGGARVRALAEKWGVGRLLDPEAIRALLDKARGGGDDAAGADAFEERDIYSIYTRHIYIYI